MLQIIDVSKEYHTSSGKIKALDGVSLTVQRGERVGIVGANGCGKSTLIRIVGGVERPTAGTVVKQMSTSWPLAFRTGIQPQLSAYENIKFLSRIYRQDPDAVKDYIENFTELGERLNDQVWTYSSGMRAKISLALSFAFEFDCYLVDEIIAVGDRSFRQKCKVELFDKRGDRALLMVSHQPSIIRRYCSIGVALEKGRFIEQFQTSDRIACRRYLTAA